MVLDAIVKHLKRTVVFILLLETVAKCTLAWLRRQKSRRTRYTMITNSWKKLVFAISRQLCFTKSNSYVASCPSSELKSLCKILIPSVSLFASSLDDISFFFPVYFLDLIEHYNALLPPTTARSKRESQSNPQTYPGYRHTRTGTTSTAKSTMISVILLPPAPIYAFTM